MIPASQIERISRIGYGWADTRPTPEDVPLVLRALADEDVATSNFACLAVEKMAPRGLFDAPSARTALSALVPKLRSPDAHTSEWSARAVGSLAFHTDLVPAEQQAVVLAEMLLMMQDSHPELRRRGLALAERLLPLLDPREREQVARVVLAACRRPRDGSDAAERAWHIGLRTLAVAARYVEYEGRAGEVAQDLLRALNELSPQIDHIRIALLAGLASLAGRVGTALRGRIVRAALAATSDATYRYSRTSGVYSPPRHAGADALAVLAPLLDRELIEEAQRAMDRAALNALNANGPRREGTGEHESMYGAALNALAERRRQIEGR